MNKFKYQLGEIVKMKLSEEHGVVQGRAEYIDSQNQYRVLYMAADGRQVEAWWSESQLA